MKKYECIAILHKKILITIASRPDRYVTRLQFLTKILYDVLMTSESQIEQAFITKLQELKYTYRQDIRDLAALKQNFREKFEALTRAQIHLSPGYS